MIGRLLCRLGLHRWRGPQIVNDWNRGSVRFRSGVQTCGRRCGAVRDWHRQWTPR